MKRRSQSKLVFLVAGALLIAVAGRAVAHHSFAATYQADDRIEIEGKVKELVWRNPHSFLRIDVEDEDGNPQTWSLEWTSANRLAGSSMTRTTLRPNDVVVAIGSPARTPGSPRMLLRQLKRPSDGWEWIGDID
ncbi:MAG: DUF6152 family protein [Candidatus Rariloculaceae bacterium]